MVLGSVVVMPPPRRRRKRQTTGADLQPILKAAFCDEIPAGSIVPGSCDLKVLAYDPATFICDFLLTFDILDATALETSLNDINDNINTNTAITDAGFIASPGTIGKFRDHPKVSLLGVVALLGDCPFIPADFPNSTHQLHQHIKTQY